MAPTHLRVEHLDEPLGVMLSKPRLSWRLPKGAKRQVAYQVRAGHWDSGWVTSDRCLLVPYEGPSMRSTQHVKWWVRVRTDIGESGWSKPSWWEMGLLDPSDWVAAWIAADEVSDMRSTTPRPGYSFRKLFTVSTSIARARIYATAHGLYELFLNDERVGNMELTPGYTSYRSTLQVQTFDATNLIRQGNNVLCAVVTDGWFRGQTSGLRLTNVYGDRVALLAQLNMNHADGSLTRIGTGEDWTWGTMSIRTADLIQGQSVDMRRENPEFEAPVRIEDYDLSRLRCSPAPPVRRVAELQAMNITRPAPDRQVIDLGQNINGWIRLTKLGPAGTRIQLTYGETLDRNGEVTQDHLMPDFDLVVARQDPEFAHLFLPFQRDQVISAGRSGDEFEPRHTTHGFRYVQVEGNPEELRQEDIVGIVVHTDMQRRGWFSCSDNRVNRLHDAALWSFRGNACDIPTDCPTRERAGWTGDWQIFVSTAAFLYDIAGFSTKWLHDLAAEQLPDGAVTNCVPEPVSIEQAKRLGYDHGCAGWGDAAVIVPWEIYRAYGDEDLLAAQWASMTSWVDYAARAAREHRHPDRISIRPTPAPHESFIWDTGFHWGEWLEPYTTPDLSSHTAIDHGDVATAYLHHSAQLLAQIARILGRDNDAHRYYTLATATKAAWQAEYITTNGTLTTDTQAAHVRALAFNLVPSELRQSVVSRLVDLIHDADTHLRTGFLATPSLLPVLAEAGQLDLAYQLLFRDTEPSWLTMIDHGATTIWEAWNGLDELNTPYLSLNHYSKGAVISFLHRYVAGIRLLDSGPAYQRFAIAPMPGGGLTFARAAHDCPYGRIEASWQIDVDRLSLQVSVPPGTTADVYLPDGQRHRAQPGTATYTCLAQAAKAP